MELEMSGRSWVAEFRIQESDQGVKIHKEVASIITEIKEV